MKKVFALLLTSVLVLGACSNRGAEQKSEKVSENKVQYKNNTVVLNQAVLYIKDTFILNNQDNGKKEIVFKYEVKNKTDKEEITPSNIFIVSTQIKQDNGNTVDNLNVGMSLVSNGKYKKWLEHSNDTIKKGKIAKGMSGYELKNDKKVTVKFTQGAGGRELGKKVYDLSKLKTVDYSTSEEANNALQSSDENNQTETTDSENSAIMNPDTSTQVKEKVSNNHNDNTAKTNSQVETSSNQSNSMASQQVSESNQNKPITHDELQVEDPYTPSYAQYQANKKFSDDVRSNPSKYEGGGIGGGPGLVVNENKTYNQYKERVIKEYKQLQP
ncbi:DUF5067 domain-containing protein [Staphylococcus debuckii]|uniref:DUF5067 domain-containing protein n=1 Tax=Staphylococcus debuckii TaxID=2044912 RepID=UPI000F437933|nr:DUF5067 domain-containing protein [Staphylococcus debuckii]AYU54608.1 DUF5067 domain-containing protein [Staphylococcus debuckii]